jgi:long-chain acyl-CoA synthetase
VGDPKTFREVIEAHASRAAGAPFAFAPEPDRVMGYGELREAVGALHALYVEHAVAAGDIVAFMLPNGLSALQLFLGTMASGRVVSPMNLIAQDAHVDHVLAHARPKLLFATADHAGRLEAAMGRTGVTARLLTIGADGLARRGRIAEDLPQVEADSPAMLMYTSGTTGVPKGALLTHANMLYAGRAVAAHQSLTESDRVLSSLPLYHINGQCIATVGTLVSGGSIVMPHRFSTSQWWPLCERYRPTWLNLVPTIVAYLLNAPEPTPQQRAALRGIRFARSASAPLSPEHQLAFEARFGIPIVEAMGLTECASVAFCNPMDRGTRKVGSAGRPLGVRARVVARDGCVLATGERGEIQVAGPNVMSGYYRAPDATAQALSSDGWLATGDLGYRDEDGFYFITGRLKELIIKGGENIAPREIDEALLKHPAVLEAAAVGVADDAYGQEILACVVRKAGADVDEPQLRAHCLRELGPFKTPRHFRFLDELPKGPSGKVQRRKLAEAWGG